MIFRPKLLWKSKNVENGYGIHWNFRSHWTFSVRGFQDWQAIFQRWNLSYPSDLQGYCTFLFKSHRMFTKMGKLSYRQQNNQSWEMGPNSTGKTLTILSLLKAIFFTISVTISCSLPRKFNNLWHYKGHFLCRFTLIPWLCSQQGVVYSQPPLFGAKKVELGFFRLYPFWQQIPLQSSVWKGHLSRVVSQLLS